jgi:hypothetical protein
MYSRAARPRLWRSLVARSVLRSFVSIAAVLFVFAVPLPILFLVTASTLPQGLVNRAFMAVTLVFAGPAAYALPGPGNAVGEGLNHVWMACSWAVVGLILGLLTTRTRSTLLIAALAALAVVGALVPMMIVADARIAADWRRQPVKTVRQLILRKTPIGTSMTEVSTVVANEGWQLREVNRDRGFQIESRDPLIGSRYIRANLGNYPGNPFSVNVTVLWGFDDAEQLVDIRVWRTVDAL